MIVYYALVGLVVATLAGTAIGLVMMFGYWILDLMEGWKR